MTFYGMPRTRKVLAIIVHNSSFPSDDDAEALKDTFEQFDNSEVRILESCKVDLNKMLAEEQFSEFNIFVLFVLSDLQAGYSVSRFPGHGKSLDIGLLTRAVVGNSSLLGYPKILVFASSVVNGGHPDMPLSCKELTAEFTTGEPGQSLANKELSSNAKFFWDIFVAKVVTGNVPLSSFIQELCKAIQNDSPSKHFMELFMGTIEKVNPEGLELLNQLRKELFLLQGNLFFRPRLRILVTIGS